MNYDTYKQIAKKYIIEKKESLDVLNVYNHSFEEETSQYMLKQMLQYCDTNGQ